MRYFIPLLLLAAPLAAPVQAQDLSGYALSFDLGLGAEYSPEYMGSDEKDVSPWIILRNASLGRQGAAGETTDGFSVLPSFNYVGRRDPNDHDALEGMENISAAGEVGVRLGYDLGPSTSYVTLRKGFGGHHGLRGELGTKYDFRANDRLTFTGRANANYGNDDFAETYFGVTDAEAATSRYAAYRPDGGFHSVAVSLEARYAMTDTLAVLGEIEYERLIGDAADSPLVEDKGQPSIKLGIVRRFDFRF
ncbi:MipA/OmpV family protein [Paracoccus cavernae]|uniref:MipA/OmpV family protein n=1 Tax=Paracoccus cavernae TaxID=1571207 RepID=UPI0035F42D68